MKKFRVGKFKMIYAGSTLFDFPTLDFLVWKIKQLEIIFNFPTLCSQGKKILWYFTLLISLVHTLVGSI